MNPEQISKSASTMSDAVAGLSGVIGKIVSWFQSMSIWQILILIIVLGTGFYLWYLMTAKPSHSNYRHQY